MCIKDKLNTMYVNHGGYLVLFDSPNAHNSASLAPELRKYPDYMKMKLQSMVH